MEFGEIHIKKVHVPFHGIRWSALFQPELYGIFPLYFLHCQNRLFVIGQCVNPDWLQIVSNVSATLETDRWVPALLLAIIGVSSNYYGNVVSNKNFSSIKVKVVNLYNIPHEAYLRCSGIGVKVYHSFTCTPCISSTSRMNHTCLFLPSCSWYSFTDPGEMEGWVDLGAK